MGFQSQLAQGLQLRRRRDAAPAGRDDAAHDSVARQHRAGNRSNPDPRNWVGYGQRTIDEMAFAWVTWTYLEEEDYKAMVADRAKRRATERER